MQCLKIMLHIIIFSLSAHIVPSYLDKNLQPFSSIAYFDCLNFLNC